MSYICVNCKRVIEDIEGIRHCKECRAVICIQCRKKYTICEDCEEAECY